MKNTDRLIGILDSEQENQRLELVIEPGEVPKLALKLVTYSKGLGWHTQKTIHIDNSQAEELQFLLGGARSLIKQAANNVQAQPSTATKVAKATKTIEPPSQDKNISKFRPKTFPISQKKSA